MTGTAEVRHPVILWAQRKDCVYLTISVEDCKDSDVKIESDKVIFKGTGGDKVSYGCTIVLHATLKADDSKFVVRDRAIEILLKKETEAYWPRLLKDTAKMHWLRVDFNKWKDEDDSDEDMAGGNFEEMMRRMGGFGGPDAAGMGDFDAEEDSDDEGMPDLEPVKDDKEVAKE